MLIFAGAVLSRNAMASEVSEIPVSYKLPYPGILPNSPLYILKNLRDQTVQLFVLGPVNKSFYALLMADKRTLAGQMLIENNNDSLGAETLVSAEEYYSNAVKEAVLAKKQNLNVSELAAKLLVASSKHEEILTGASTMVSGDALDDIARAISLNQKSRNLVVELNASR